MRSSRYGILRFDLVDITFRHYYCRILGWLLFSGVPQPIPALAFAKKPTLLPVLTHFPLACTLFPCACQDLISSHQTTVVLVAVNKLGLSNSLYWPSQQQKAPIPLGDTTAGYGYVVIPSSIPSCKVNLRYRDLPSPRNEYINP